MMLGALLLPTAARAADISDLLKVFSGTFDSKAQWDMEDNANLMERDRHPWTTVIHAPIVLPAVGERVFYVEEHRDAKPDKLVRQRVVSFVSDGNAVRMTQFAFKNPNAMRGAANDSARWAALSRDELIPLEGCDLVWKVNADELWAGEIPGKTCAAPAAAGRARYVAYRVTMTPLMYQRVDRILFADTDALSEGYADELPTVHIRTSAGARDF